MRCVVVAGIVTLVVAVVALLSPQRTTQASWTDQASTSASLSSLSVAPTLTCTQVGFNGRVDWTQPVTPYGNAPVTYTATLQNGSGPKNSVPVTGTAPNASVSVVGSITLVDYPITVEVTSSLPGTSWTATRSLTVVVRGLLNGWQVACP